MPYFDRFDICEAYAVLEWDWNMGGWLQERPTNRRRMEATSVQLARLGFKPRPNLSFRNLDGEWAGDISGRGATSWTRSGGTLMEYTLFLIALEIATTYSTVILVLKKGGF